MSLALDLLSAAALRHSSLNNNGSYEFDVANPDSPQQSSTDAEITERTNLVKESLEGNYVRDDEDGDRTEDEDLCEQLNTREQKFAHTLPPTVKVECDEQKVNNVLLPPALPSLNNKGLVGVRLGFGNPPVTPPLFFPSTHVPAMHAFGPLPPLPSLPQHSIPAPLVSAAPVLSPTSQTPFNSAVTAPTKIKLSTKKAAMTLSAPLPPPPPSPPPPLSLDSKPINAAVPHLVPEDSGIIRCVCPYNSDDGFTIQCDGCNVWQHATCVGISPENVPEEYSCELCDPQGASERGVDKNQAEEWQRRRLEAENTRSSQSKFGVGFVSETPHRQLNEAQTIAADLAAVLPLKGKHRRKSVGEGSLQQSSNPGMTNSQATSMAQPSTTPEASPSGTRVSSVSRDAIGRKRRQTKQPSSNKARINASAALTAAIQSDNQNGSRNTASTPSTAHANTALAPPPRLTTISSIRSAAPYPNSRENLPVSDDEDFGDDSYEMWQYEFTPLDKDRYLDRRIARDLRELAKRLSKQDAKETQSVYAVPFDILPTATSAIAVKPLLKSNFFLLPPAASTYIPTSSQTPTCPYPRPSIHALFAVAPIAVGQYIAPVRGQILSIEGYRSDPLNQYSVLGVPKQGVRFLPYPISVAIDSRLFGNETRFARSGCHPNAVVKMVYQSHQEDATTSTANFSSSGNQSQEMLPFAFAIFATREIERREEIILPWDWDDNHIIHALPPLLNAPPLPAGLELPDLEPLSRKMSVVMNTLVGVNHCACEKKRDCGLFWMSRAAGVSIVPLKSGQMSRSEPFSSLLLEALGVVKEEETTTSWKTQQKKTRKLKKPDLGMLLGAVRHWIRSSKSEIQNSSVALEKGGYDEEVKSIDDSRMDVDGGMEPVTTTTVSIPPSKQIHPPTQGIATIPETKPVILSSLELPFKSHSSPKRRNVKLDQEGDDFDSDSGASDLTEPLSHPSDSENDRVYGKKWEDKKAEMLIRSPSRKQSKPGPKHQSTTVGPTWQKTRDISLERKKLIRRGLVGKVGRLGTVSSVKKARKGLVPVVESPKKDLLSKRRVSAPVEILDEVPSVDLQAMPSLKENIVVDERLPSQASQPTALTTTDEPIINAESGPAKSTGEPAILPLSLELELPAPLEPEVPKPPPKARLSLAAYRQRQAQKPLELSEATAAVLSPSSVTDSSTSASAKVPVEEATHSLPVPSLSTDIERPVPKDSSSMFTAEPLSIASTAEPLSVVPKNEQTGFSLQLSHPLPSPSHSFTSAEAILNSIGDYFQGKTVAPPQERLFSADARSTSLQFDPPAKSRADELSIIEAKPYMPSSPSKEYDIDSIHSMYRSYPPQVNSPPSRFGQPLDRRDSSPGNRSQEESSASDPFPDQASFSPRGKQDWQKTTGSPPLSFEESSRTNRPEVRMQDVPTGPRVMPPASSYIKPPPGLGRTSPTMVSSRQLPSGPRNPTAAPSMGPSRTPWASAPTNAGNYRGGAAARGRFEPYATGASRGVPTGPRNPSGPPPTGPRSFVPRGRGGMPPWAGRGGRGRGRG